MSRRILIATAAVAMLVMTAGSALAVSPHYVTGPSVSISGNSLTVSGKAAGLGNITTADASLTGSVTVFSRCYNRGGNKPQADNKQETIPVNQSETFDVTNGRTNFSFTVTPLSTLTCPGN